MKTSACFLFLILLPLLSIAQSVDPTIDAVKGPDILTSQPVTPDLKNSRGLVVVFLSAVCPCSNSHLGELSTLAKEHPDFKFIGIHSNPEEEKNSTQDYFREAGLPFPVIQDEHTRIADSFKALKTPHAFVLLKEGRIAYQGGVSSSRHFDEKVERRYLREALVDLAAGREVKTPRSRPLGCAISRGAKDVW